MTRRMAQRLTTSCLVIFAMLLFVVFTRLIDRARPAPPSPRPLTSEAVVRGADGHDYVTFGTRKRAPSSKRLLAAVLHTKACRACAAKRHATADTKVAVTSNPDVVTGLTEGADGHQYVTFQTTYDSDSKPVFLLSVFATVLHSQECAACAGDSGNGEPEAPASSPAAR